MKQELMTEVIQQMLPYLDNAQLKQLRRTMEQTLFHYEVTSRARRRVKKDSIIYSTVRPNQHHFGIIKLQPENFLVSTGFAVIGTDAKVLNADFLYYLLTQTILIEALHAIAEQSTSAYPSIKPSDIEDLEIEIPDLATQKKIASILGIIGNKIT